MTLDLIATNVFSVPVLAFALGLLAAAIKADLRLPDAAYQAISIYLLLAIGLKGGVALREADLAEVAAPVAVAIILGVTIPILAFLGLRFLTKLGPVDRGALAAHYGSTSLVTFTAALVFLESLNVSYEGYVATLLAILEIPGILVGLLLAGSMSKNPAGADAPSQRRWAESLREVLTGRSVLLLAGGLVMGVLTGPEGFVRVEPFFGGLFTGVLALFLLEMGMLAGRRLGDLRQAGFGLVVFAIVFPIVAGILGIGGRVARWNVDRRRDGARCSVRQCFLHCRTGRGSPRVANCQSWYHPHRQPRYDFSIQSRHRHPAVLGYRAMAGTDTGLAPTQHPKDL